MINQNPRDNVQVPIIHESQHELRRFIREIQLKHQIIDKQNQSIKQSANNKNKKLIQKIKKQTEDLKQIKKSMSINRFSRLIQMRRLTESKLSQSYDCNQEIKVKESKKIVFGKQEYQKNNIQLNFNQKDAFHVKQQKKENQSQNAFQNKANQKHVNQKKNEISISQQNNLKIQVKESGKQEGNQNQINYQSQREKYNFQQSHSHANSRSTFFIKQLNRKNSLQKTMKYRFQQRLKQSKQKIVKNKIKLLQSQTNFKLQKKIKQNVELIKKQKILNEIVQRRMEHQRLKERVQQKRRQQKRLIHEGNIMKINTQKSFKVKYVKQQLNFQRSRSQQSLLNMTFKSYLKQKQQVQKQQLLAYKYTFMKGVGYKDMMTTSNFAINNPQQKLIQRPKTQSSIGTRKSIKSLTLYKKQDSKK